MLLTHRVALLEQSTGVLLLRRGPRTVDRAETDEIEYALGEAERGSIALIGVRAAGERRRGGQEERRWVSPELGRDAASSDGPRTLQSAAGLRPAPPRPALGADARRRPTAA